jgi:hypothetical protein
MCAVPPRLALRWWTTPIAGCTPLDCAQDGLKAILCLLDPRKVERLFLLIAIFIQPSSLVGKARRLPPIAKLELIQNIVDMVFDCV